MPIAKWHWDTLIPIFIPSLLLCSSLFFLFLLRHIWWYTGFTPGPYSETTGLRKPYGIWWFTPGINNCIQDKSYTHVYHFSPLLLLLLLCFLFHFILEPVLVVRRLVSSDLFPGLHSYITVGSSAPGTGSRDTLLWLWTSSSFPPSSISIWFHSLISVTWLWTPSEGLWDAKLHSTLLLLCPLKNMQNFSNLSSSAGMSHHILTTFLPQLNIFFSCLFFYFMLGM